MRQFEPLFSNPHVLTILGNFWPRKYDFSPFATERRLVRTDDDTQVLVQTQRPRTPAVGEIVMVHGLEGSGDSGYMVSLAWDMLHAGFISHRFHMRTCGGTESLSRSLYHAGLTSDLRFFVEQSRPGRAASCGGRGLPVFLVGFSLGGNVVLKLAGELGETDLIAGVCAVSTPLDLAKGVERLGRPENRIYQRRFVSNMRKRMLATGRHSPVVLRSVHSVYEIDDRITAPSFGFGTADRYYATQSAKNFLRRIRVPTLLVQAKDDPLIPFEIYRDPAVAGNPNLRLVATEHGGHLGFLSKRAPRFWVDGLILEFLREALRGASAIAGETGAEIGVNITL